jgi:hypothetical protein
MKKLLYILGSSLFLLWSCEPLEDTYEELDKDQGAYSEDISVTLSEDDYSTLSGIAEKLGNTDAADYVDENMAFSEQYPAADFVPPFLDETYLALNESSSANVTFNYMEGNPESVSSYMLNYSFSQSDYMGVDPVLEFAEAFTPSFPADESVVLGIIENQYPDEVEGALAYISYRVSDIDLSETPEMFFEEHFDGSFGDFENISLEGEQEWFLDDYDDDEYAKISGYSGGAQVNDDWLVSPPVDLTEQASAFITIRQAANYLDDWANLKVLVSTDYSGNVEEATWDELTFQERPEGNSWDFVESEALDISNFAGQNIHVAFNYNSSADGAATWEIDWLKISKTPVPKFTYISDLFINHDGWQRLAEDYEEDFDDGVYLMQEEDYDAMGAPGEYDNFSESDHYDNYLPQFLSVRMPYAQEDEKVIVAFMYYGGSTVLNAAQYVFNGNEWQNSSRIVERTEQFIHNGNEWVFDPTVTFTMESSDYQLIVDYVRSEIGEDYINQQYQNTEYYFGADAHYNNFDLRLSAKLDRNVPGYEGLSTEEAVALSYERLTEAVEVLLQEKYPDAMAQVNGVDVFYIVTVDTYENDLSRGKYTYTFQCVKSAPNPEFELIEGPEF